jgi:hypothetical protein
MHPREPHLQAHGRPSVVQLLIEVALIVFSILLALSFESCREHRKQRERAESALHAIRAEIETNKTAIAASLPLQRAQLASLREMAAADGRQPLRLSSALAPPRLTSSAFDTATMTGALSAADFETILAISRAYTAQRWTARFEDGWMRVVLSPDAWDQRNASRSASLLLGVLTEYVAVETKIDAAYDDVLRRVRGDETSSAAAAPSR